MPQSSSGKHVFGILLNVVVFTVSRGGHLYMLQLQPDLVTLYIAEMGMAHSVTPYTTEKSQSHCDFLPN